MVASPPFRLLRRIPSHASRRTFSSPSPAPAPRPLDLTFFTKEVCSLCEEAYPVLEAVGKKVPFKLRKVDIEKDENHVAFRKYRYDIPVLAVTGTEELVMRHRFDAAKLEAKLRALAAAQAGDDR
ncbi:glutaredoxin-like domain-containing protein [Hyaloraphidium curvatum]|nr:glutaredoxin-like domain-containing protein [Hyaloraphidium curvatum]